MQVTDQEQQPTTQQPETGPGAQLDLDALAMKIVKLLFFEMQIEKDRLGKE